MTAAADTIHLLPTAPGGPMLPAGRGYCGRRAAHIRRDPSRVTCTDCHAARRADQENHR